MSYSKLAYVYDLLMEDAPYDEWESFLETILTQEKTSPKRVLDLGCGTGEMTLRLANKYPQVIGIDNSDDMLSYAQMRSNSDELQNVTFLNQDIRNLNGIENQDLVLSVFDVINYITSKNDLLDVFQGVFKSLNKKGLFIFDAHHIEHFNKNMVGQTFAEIYDDISYVWFCEAGEKAGEVMHDLTFFVQHGQMYERFDEQHFQRTFTVNEYRKILNEAGFKKIDVYGDFNPEVKNEAREQWDRTFFVCEKE